MNFLIDNEIEVTLTELIENNDLDQDTITSLTELSVNDTFFIGICEIKKVKTVKKYITTIKTTDKNLIEDIKRYNGIKDKNGLWIISATTKYEKEQNDLSFAFQSKFRQLLAEKKILSKEERIARFRKNFGAKDTQKTTNQYGSVEWWVNGMNGE